MAVTYKDIDTLTNKSIVSGTEKIPVSDTEYITPNQIAGLNPNITISTSTPTSSQGSNGDIWIVV